MTASLVRIPRLLTALCVLASSALPVPGGASEDTGRLRIELAFPGDDVPVGAEGPWGFFSGQVLAYQGELEKIDLILLLDVSGSTNDSSGIDVDGDGKVRGKGFGRLFGSSRGDSILSAEVAAARVLLGQLDSRTTRVGVVVFSGVERGVTDALTEVPLTTDYRRVERGLEELSLVPPAGGTNLYAGLRRAAQELLGRGGDSQRRKGAQRYIVLLTDGKPTLPGDPNSREPTDRAIGIARLLRKQRIRVESFALGPDAVAESEAAREAARITGGRYTAVGDLADLEDRITQVRFLDVESLELTNRTTDARAECQVLTPEGRFFALVPVRAGDNELTLRATSQGGAVSLLERRVRFDPGAPLEARLDADQRRQLIRLRELCRRPDTPAGEPKRRRLEIETKEDAP